MCAGLGLLLSRLTGVTPLEGYLASTPGGVYAVPVTAISAGGDVTFVVAVQVLRVIVMLLVAPAPAGWWAAAAPRARPVRDRVGPAHLPPLRARSRGSGVRAVTGCVRGWRSTVGWPVSVPGWQS